jgi:dUTP pyrophosphatase
MGAIARFEKVSYEQFERAMMDFYSSVHSFAAEVTVLPINEVYEGIGLPTRATAGSAGYDFEAPFTFKLEPGESIKIPTGIRVAMEKDWFLGMFPRSGLGFKYRMQLDNTIGVVDSDYYYSDNEGHIFAKITNDGKEGKKIEVGRGEKFMQGIFMQYGLAEEEGVKGTRNGGFGSTGK